MTKLSRFLLITLTSVSMLLTSIIVTANLSKLYAEEQTEEYVTRADVQSAYALFKDKALSENLQLSSYTYGHEYIIQVADYYQVYTSNDGKDAIIVCDVTFDKKTYTIKFNVANTYYAGLDPLLEDLRYAKALTPESFINPNGEGTGVEELTQFGVAVDENGDGLTDYFTEPDGKTAYPRELFSTEYDWQIYVVQHPELYIGLVDIEDNGEIYWAETGEYIGYNDDYNILGHQGGEIHEFADPVNEVDDSQEQEDNN